jgi:DNA polymerase III alpha subunit
LCRKIKPKSIEDCSIITTLARPHAKKIREAFVDARNGKKKFKPFHKCLERAFEKTLGFPLYEESLLMLVQDAAKWDLHKADGLRKMTKDKGKHPEKEKKLKEDFICDAQKDGGLSSVMANKVWNDIIQNYSEYSFNHSHAALYSMTSYVTAYLKAHYPLEFLTANLIFESNSNSPQAEDNKLKIKDEIRALGVKIIPPDINRSESTYTIIDDHTLMAGLDSLKYMGKDAMPEITGKRPFKSFDDFLSKIEPKLVRSPAVSALAASGALDSFGLSRKQMFLYASDYKKKIQLWKKKINPGEFQYPWPKDIGDWSIREKFAMEKHYIGEGLSGNFGQIYPGFFDKNWVNFSKLKEYFPADKAKGESYVDSTVGNLQGVIKSIFEFIVKKEGSKLKGQTMAKLTIEDLEGNVIGLTLFPDKLTEVKETMKAIYGTKIKLEPWVAIHFNGFANWYEGDICLTLDGIKKCAPPPQKPDDLKSRTVKMKISLTKKEKMQQTSFDFEEKVDDETKEIIDEMEEHCFEEGVPFDEEVEYEP